MGTTGPWRTAFGSTQGACADHPPAGLGEPIIRGLFSVSAPFRDDVNSAHIDPSPTPQGFALLGQALHNTLPSIFSDGLGLPEQAWAGSWPCARARSRSAPCTCAGIPRSA